MRYKFDFIVNIRFLNKLIFRTTKLKQKFSIKGKLVFKSVKGEIVKNIANDLFQNKAAGGDIALNLLKIVPLFFRTL